MSDIVAMPTSPAQCMEQLKALSIPYDLYTHDAVFTVAESKKTKNMMDGDVCHTRNMFLRTKKKENYLVTLSDDTPVDLKKLEKMLGVKNFSFGSPGRLMEILGVYPGSVTPLSVMNAKAGDITIILEEKMMQSIKVAYHPLINTMSVVLTPDDLVTFIKSYGHTPQAIDLSNVAP